MTETRLRQFLLPGAAVFALLTFAAPRISTSATSDDVLARSRAAYASLHSYADTGVVVVEYGASSRDQHTFATYFNRNPRGFYFEFRKQGGDRYVIWGDPDAFHTWWLTTGVKSDYPNPNNVGAFGTAGQQTAGSAMKVVPLLFAKAALQGDFGSFSGGVLAGTEVVSAHSCYRLTGTSHDTYGATGREVNVRSTSLWIDTESLLIRKVFEEWKALPGQISRTTITFEPQANPTIDEARFRFIPPAAR